MEHSQWVIFGDNYLTRKFNIITYALFGLQAFLRSGNSLEILRAEEDTEGQRSEYLSARLQILIN